ncbi:MULTISPECIES: hypothetical protein [Rhodopseudomonas]|uniref:hypothetical protein n=1 Tax=Rhodopseudomonas TaxID=1073 RepID=UPI000AF35EF0|nr:MULTISPECIES: hypothetical protein [Rhodopseudomonas]MDF3812195.1 hypothetical protein [Rhodopseudomonas sp. BAL398]WOK18098.1 hypothetical protein RBJ75_00805 [Rhodopseudomonas sp. BAL398]
MRHASRAGCDNAVIATAHCRSVRADGTQLGIDQLGIDQLGSEGGIRIEGS